MKKILCIGSVTCDIIVTGANAIPTPGTLRVVKDVSVHTGGCAANAAADLGRLGVPAALCCKVVEDMLGEYVCVQMEKAGVDTRYIVKSTEAGTTTSVVCVAGSGERSFLYGEGSTSQFTAEDISLRAVQECDIIFVAGAMLLKRFDGAPCARFLRQAQEAGKFTAMDTAWDFEDIWMDKIRESIAYLDLFMPSYDEAVKLTGEENPSRIAAVFKKMGAKNVVIKLGTKGALVCPLGQEERMIPAYLCEHPADTTGAGDSFAAGFLAGFAQGWDQYESARFANAVGAHCVASVGATAGIRSIEETLDFMQRADAAEKKKGSFKHEKTGV
ncbi:MAG: carbohydrate kinase family protein [Clostridiales bacterium]|nr:carbohydrate kinase family protein [Clostridiales bacterium]